MNGFLAIFLAVVMGHTAHAEVSMATQVFGIKDLIEKLPNHHFQTCNLVLSINRANFTTAESRCQQLPARVAMDRQRGTLATINSKEANDDLTMLLNIALPLKEQSKFKYAGNRWAWTGLRKVRNTDTKHIQKINKRIPYNRSDWEWYDKSIPENFESWNRGQPDQRPLKPGKKSNEYKKSGRCQEENDCRQNQMRVNHFGKWDDAFGFEEHPYACDYKGKYLVSGLEKTWTEAKEACEAIGLNLATVRSQREVEELRRALLYFLGESGFEECKGQFGHHGKQPVNKKGKVIKKKKVCASATMEERWDVEHWAWTGGNDEAKEGKFRWTDGSEVEAFANFPWIASAGKDNKAKGQAAGQNCLTISKWGEFDDSYREHKKPFACECPRG